MAMGYVGFFSGPSCADDWTFSVPYLCKGVSSSKEEIQPLRKQNTTNKRQNEARQKRDEKSAEGSAHDSENEEKRKITVHWNRRSYKEQKTRQQYNVTRQ